MFVAEKPPFLAKSSTCAGDFCPLFTTSPCQLVVNWSSPKGFSSNAKMAVLRAAVSWVDQLTQVSCELSGATLAFD